MGKATLYGYSNSRVKAMKSKLIKTDMLEKMLAVKEPESIVGMLSQTNYKQNIEEFGGVSEMGTLIDFALSKNLGHETCKLVNITPNIHRRLTREIVGRFGRAHV